MTVRKIFAEAAGQEWLAVAVAVSMSVAVMDVTRTLHPPGGAVALIAVIGSDKVKNLGYLFVLIPVSAALYIDSGL